MNIFAKKSFIILAALQFASIASASATQSQRTTLNHLQQITELAADVDSLLARLTQPNDNTSTRLQIQNECQQASIKVLQAQLDALQEAGNDLQTRYDELQAAHGTLDEQRNALQVTHAQQETKIRALQNKCIVQRANMRALEVKADKQRSECVILRHVVAATLVGATVYSIKQGTPQRYISNAAEIAQRHAQTAYIGTLRAIGNALTQGK